jgi:hypothetical protein
VLLVPVLVLEPVPAAFVLLDGAAVVPGAGSGGAVLDDVCATATLAPASANATTPDTSVRLNTESIATSCSIEGDHENHGR